MNSRHRDPWLNVDIFDQIDQNPQYCSTKVRQSHSPHLPVGCPSAARIPPAARSDRADPGLTLANLAAQTGVDGNLQPKGIQTRVATLSDRAGMSNRCAPTPTCLVRDPHASRVTASVRRHGSEWMGNRMNSGIPNSCRATNRVLANPPPSPCSGFAPFCRSENPVRHTLGDASPASAPRQAR